MVSFNKVNSVLSTFDQRLPRDGLLAAGNQVVGEYNAQLTSKLGGSQGEILNGSMSRNVLTGDQEKAKGEDYEDSGSPSGQQGEEPSFQFKEVAPPSLPAKGLLNN